MSALHRLGRCLLWLYLAGMTAPLWATSLPQSTPSLQIQKQEVTVAVLATRGETVALHRWLPLMDYLNLTIEDKHFILKPVNLYELADAVKAQSVDFIITNPGQSVQLGRQYPLSWLATLRSEYEGETAEVIGSALIVRKNSRYQRIGDLEGQPIGAAAEVAFGGYLTFKWELVKQGIEAKRFFSRIHFLGFPLDNIVNQLADKKIEAAILPACQLEDMAKEGLIDITEFRVLEQKTPTGFPCQVSTQLYPNWSFAKTGKASEQLAKEVTLALFALPEKSKAAKAAQSLGWTAPINQLTIDRLYKDLDLHPLQNPWWIEAFIWLKANQQWAWTLIIVFIALNGYHFILEYRFNRNQAKLITTQHALNEKVRQLEHIQRVAILGELGGNIAHELNQPLAAIRNYSQGAAIRLQRGTTPEELTAVLENIQRQVVRASDIILRLRNMIKQRPIQKREATIEPIVRDTVALLQQEFDREAVNVTIHQEGQAQALCLDVTGIEQLVFNLLRNALDACKEVDVSRRQIDIELHYLSDQLKLIIKDTGVGLKADFRAVSSAFFTTKTDGLGLGLSICKEIVKSHHGELTLVPNDPIGCSAQVVLSYQENSDCDE